MNRNRPPDEGKLFVVPRPAVHLSQPSRDQNRPLNLADKALVPLSLLFLAVVAFAGYACLYGDWQSAKDFLLIFLPPITALMGTAFAANSRN